MNRLFFALDIHQRDKKILHNHCAPLVDTLDNCKPVSQKLYHITLKFIPGADETVTEMLIGLCEEMETAPCPEYALSSFGVFPHIKNPTVLWAGVETDSQWIASLHSTVESLSARAGIPKETRLFTPHITVARFKKTRKTGLIKDFISNNKQKLFTSSFPGITLYQSQLTPAGPVYRPLAGRPCTEDHQ
jgi:RNA 2',3'-cyclic 3'-phosphodiesterase